MPEKLNNLGNLNKKVLVWPANKNDLLNKLQNLLKFPDFCGQEASGTDRLKLLLTKFNNDVRFVIESPYVDRHYRDTYYSYHSSKFRKTGRNCIRVHIFEGEVTEAALLNSENKLNEKYLGFFIIRPLMLHILGRSLISPKAFVENKFVCCLMKSRVSLMGNEFMVHGFPHIAQDEETHTCAESALWSHIEYFGSKYPQYKPLLPSQIIKTLLDIAEHRLLPSKGLTKEELAKCLQNNGFQCQIYSFSKEAVDPKADPKAAEKLEAEQKKNILYSTLRIYIESGIPLLLTLGGNGHGHTVLAIGHEEDDSLYNVQNYTFPENRSWIDVSYFNKMLVLIDDNMPPYQIADISRPTEHYSDTKLRDMVIKSFITSFPVHMFLPAEKAYPLMEEIFNTKIVGLQTNEEKWITRLMLTGSRSFKKHLFKADDKLEAGLKELLLRLPMPRFVWICEVYKSNEFIKDGYCSGLLIMDATSNIRSLASVLLYMVDTKMFKHDNVIWDKNPVEIVPFRMKTYRNNLKGEWSKWT
jgi:hypothetical protein